MKSKDPNKVLDCFNKPPKGGWPKEWLERVWEDSPYGKKWFAEQK